MLVNSVFFKTKYTENRIEQNSKQSEPELMVLGGGTEQGVVWT